MAQSAPFVALVALLLINTYCSADNVYCVTLTQPNATSCSLCPPKSNHCATLSEYARQAEMYFTSNTTMSFLPGNHALDVSVIVANISRLTMRGRFSTDSIATIVRNGSAGFSFTNALGINIHSLAFTSCNRSWSCDSCSDGNSALHLQSTQYANLVNCSFHDNFGTALAVHNTNITLAENNEFIHNECECESFSGRCELGCGVTAVNSSLTFTGNTTFFGNRKLDNLYGAGAIWASTSSLRFTGTNNFIGNSAEYGSAIYAETNTSLSFTGTSNFNDNSAGYESGAIYTVDSVVFAFNGNNNFIRNSGGAIHVLNNISMSFTGTSNFNHNSAHSGGAIYAVDNVVLIFNGTNSFTNNSANNGGVIYAVAKASLSFTGISNFSGNSAMLGGAIAAKLNSTLTFNGSVSFTNNGLDTSRLHTHIDGDSRGGAMHLAVNSTFSILPHTIVLWEYNHATLGGAIYVFNANPLIYCAQIATYIPKQECFFQLSSQNLSSGINAQLVFKNNSADAAGSMLYGGAIDNCTFTGMDDSYNSGKVFDMLVQYGDDNKTSRIASDPFHICPCENNYPNCSMSRKTLSVYPGETFQISVFSTGQRNGTVPSQVRSHLSTGRLLSSQYIQQAAQTCTTLSYTVFSLQNVTLELYADGPCSTFGDKLVLLLNESQYCPPGFSLDENSCVCDEILQKYTNHCNITNGLGQITRKSNDPFWVGYDQSQGVTVHPYCPFDFCVSDTVAFSLNSTMSDKQCAFNRSGLLCGACKANYSLVLGTSHCKRCNNYHLDLLIPFALMGIALVFLLLVCKLTVAEGTLSGLVFYANIVGVNRTIFLPAQSPDGLSTFIAWINLDIGIETCFYNGMNAYTKTWLQFVFPVYIWMLVGLIIFTSHFSQKFANLLGKSPVSVLATLILLSYTKVLRTLITAVSFTSLKYPEGHYVRRVWLHDANVDYLVGIHIPLFLVAVLVFFFLFLPYTLLLLFGQWLQAISHLKFFSWVNSARLKPFMDSYHAPYKAQHRYWPGLLLVLRFFLLLAFAFNRQQDPSINLLAIVVGAGILQLWAWVSGGVYRSRCLDALEGSFAMNLIVLGVATYHVQLSGGNQLAVGYISVCMALVTFIGILAYHIFQQLKSTNLWRKVTRVQVKLKLNKKCQQAADPQGSAELKDSSDQLRESLLESATH